MAQVEITALDVLVLKKLVLVSAALGKALTDQKAAREQMAMVREVNDFVLRADLAVKSQSQPTVRRGNRTWLKLRILKKVSAHDRPGHVLPAGGSCANRRPRRLSGG